jgi:hypothetical protein
MRHTVRAYGGSRLFAATVSRCAGTFLPSVPVLMDAAASEGDSTVT